MWAYITLDLKELGLTHARGKSDKCGGSHEIHIDPDKIEYEGDDPADIPAAQAALQRFHEKLHPGGSVFAGDCWDDDCQALAGALGISQAITVTTGRTVVKVA